MKKLLFIFSLFVVSCLVSQNRRVTSVNCKDVEFFYLSEGNLSKVSLPVYENDTLNSLSERLKMQIAFQLGAFRLCKLVNKSESLEEKICPIYLDLNENLFNFCSSLCALFLDDLFVKVQEDTFFQEIKHQIENKTICVRTGSFHDSLYFPVNCNLQDVLNGVAEFEGSQKKYSLFCGNDLSSPVYVNESNYSRLSRLVTMGFFKFFAKEYKN